MADWLGVGEGGGGLRVKLKKGGGGSPVRRRGAQSPELEVACRHGLLCRGGRHILPCWHCELLLRSYVRGGPRGRLKTTQHTHSTPRHTWTHRSQNKPQMSTNNNRKKTNKQTNTGMGEKNEKSNEKGCCKHAVVNEKPLVPLRKPFPPNTLN